MNAFSKLRRRLAWRLFVLLSGIGAVACIVTGLARLWADGAGSSGLWFAIAATVLLSGVVSLLLAWLLAAQSQRLAEVARLRNVRRSLHRDLMGTSSIFVELASAWNNAMYTLEEAHHREQQRQERLSTSLREFARMMARAVDERTGYLRGHSERVATYAAEIARSMGLHEAEVETIHLSALLHDIGMIGIEDGIVSKSTPLSAEEFEIVKAHTVKGAALLRSVEAFAAAIPGVELHHESLDGKGYPYGLSEAEIPLAARIIAVADSFDAMTTSRPYQDAMDPAYVLEVLGRLAGKRYDSHAVAALSSLISTGVIVVRNPRPLMLRHLRPRITAKVS